MMDDGNKTCKIWLKWLPFRRPTKTCKSDWNDCHLEGLGSWDWPGMFSDWKGLCNTYFLRTPQLVDGWATACKQLESHGGSSWLRILRKNKPQANHRLHITHIPIIPHYSPLFPMIPHYSPLFPITPLVHPYYIPITSLLHPCHTPTLRSFFHPYILW